VLTRWLAPYAERVNRYVEATPMRRAATPDDIADAVAFMALGTTLVTGQVLVVDGGRTV
jgi:3-oxoacyl-[acyl-carrier protein] reductase